MKAATGAAVATVVDGCKPVCAACGQTMCQHWDCTSPQVRMADGRCFNCGNLRCVRFVLPPCVDRPVAMPWVM